MSSCQSAGVHIFEFTSRRFDCCFDSFVISAALPPAPEPTTIGDWVIGASRIYRYCTDIGKPLPSDYHAYVQSIVELAKYYTMAAVNTYDTAFRRHRLRCRYHDLPSHAPWRDGMHWGL